MRLRSAALGLVVALMLLGTTAWADQIILKDGTVYSGKFVRGDSQKVDFRILGRVESFKTADISQIVFKEPELETPSTANEAAPPSAPAPPEQPAPAPEPKSQVAQQQQPPQDRSSSAVTLPEGTPLTIRTSSAIDTDRNRVGDIFDATLDEDLVYGNRTVIRRGATVKGRIAYAKESGKLTGQSQLILELTELDANGKSYLLNTSDYTEVGASRGKKTAATVGGTAALGAVIGAIAGGGTGAAVGAASGAAVGTGVQILTRGQVIRIPAETILEFRLQSPLTIDVP